jgi:hypothetical protein
MALVDLMYNLGSSQRDTTLQDIERQKEKREQIKFAQEQEERKSLKDIREEYSANKTNSNSNDITSNTPQKGNPGLMSGENTNEQSMIDKQKLIDTPVTKGIRMQSSNSTEYADLLEKRGFPEKAEKVRKLRSEYMKNMAEKTKQDRENADQEMEFTANLFRNVESKPQHDAAWDVHDKMFPDSDLHENFSPNNWKENTEMIQSFGLTAKDSRMSDYQERQATTAEKRLTFDEKKLGLKEKTNIEKTKKQYKEKLEQDDEVLRRLNNVLTKVQENPNAIGLRGWAKKMLAKGFGTIGLNAAENWIETEGDIQTEAGVNMLTGILIPYVTGDTSGRYSDKDMERVDEINNARELYTTPRRVTATIKELMNIIRQGRINTKRLMDNPDYDVNSPEATATEAPTTNETLPNAPKQPARTLKYSDYYMK